MTGPRNHAAWSRNARVERGERLKPHPILRIPKERLNDNNKAHSLGKRWCERGWPRDANPFHFSKQKLQYDAFHRGWDQWLDHYAAAGVQHRTMDELYDFEKQMHAKFVARKGYRSV